MLLFDAVPLMRCRVAFQERNNKCPAATLDNAYQASLIVRASVNINCTPLHTAADTLEVW